MGRQTRGGVCLLCAEFMRHLHCARQRKAAHGDQPLSHVIAMQVNECTLGRREEMVLHSARRRKESEKNEFPMEEG